MITVAVVGILAAVALPSYRDHVLRGYLSSLTNDLVATRVKMEQFYQDNRTYASTSTATAPCTSTATTATSKNPYTISCSSTSTTFTATATGTSSISGFTYTINQADTQSSTVSSDWGGGTSACWIMRKGDSC